MGAIVGVVIGYTLGTRAGEKGWSELMDAWKIISTSDEVRDMMSAGLAVASDLLGRSGGVLSGALGSDGIARLRSVA